MREYDDMHEYDETDHLLDSALSTYAAPSPSLEDRILRSLAVTRAMDSENRRPRSTRRWLPWAIAVPLAAALALFFLSIRKTPAPSSNYAQTAPQSHAPAVTSVPFESSIARAPSRAGHHPRTQAKPAVESAIHGALPKQDIFPSPQPLSPEEQALVALAAHAPEAVRQSLIEGQDKVDAPITISAIQIQPLKMPDAGQN